LGEHIFNKFIDLKSKEWDEFRKTVTEWEIKKYIKLI